MTDTAPDDLAPHLAVTHYLNHDAPEIRAIVARALEGVPADASQTVRAIRLFDHVRDGWRYDPYAFGFEPGAYRASVIAREQAAFCVPKAILLAACLRAAGIPASPGFADVRNHLNTPKLAELMGTDVFLYHGYVQLWADGRSWKVTPAFNMALCERFGVMPLVFDGTRDALFHEFDRVGRQHMEYVNDHGVFVEAPVETILAAFRAAYPRLEAFSRERLAGAGVIDPGFVPGTAGASQA